MNWNDPRVRYGLLAATVLLVLAATLGTWTVLPAWRLSSCLEDLPRAEQPQSPATLDLAWRFVQLGEPGMERLLGRIGDPSASSASRRGGMHVLRAMVEDQNLYEFPFLFRGTRISVRNWLREEAQEQVKALLGTVAMDLDPGLGQTALDDLYVLSLREPDFFSAADRDRIAACASWVHPGSYQRDPGSEGLREAMRHPDPAVRFQALRAAGNLEYRDADMEAAVVRLTRTQAGQVAEPAAAVKAEAARLLARWGGPAVERALDTLLSDPDPEVQIQAARGLARVGGSILDGETVLRETIPALVNRLGEVSDRVRESASAALQAICFQAPGEQASAWESWWNMNERRFDPVKARRTALAKSSDVEVRAAALHYLGELGDRFLVREIIPALGANEPEVRKQAAIALGKLESTDAVDPLLARVRDVQEDPSVRVAAARALERITGKTTGAVQRDHQVVTEVPGEQRTEAIERWASWWTENRYRERVDLLLAGLREGSTEARIRALKVFARRGPEHNLVRDDVRDALRAKEPEVRWWALTALENIGTPTHAGDALRVLQSEGESTRNRERAAEVYIALGGEPAALNAAQLATRMGAGREEAETFDAIVEAVVARDVEEGVTGFTRTLADTASTPPERKNALEALAALADKAQDADTDLYKALRTAVPRIFDYLSAPDQDQRFWATQALRKLTGSDSPKPYGYDPADTDAGTREAAADRWRRAWDQSRGG